MSTAITYCETCSAPLPQKGFFCGKCLTQFKCRICDASLEKDYLGCTQCGTPRQEPASTNKSPSANVNTFKVHETKSERTIEASFSDIVGKDIAGILRDAAANKRLDGSQKRQQDDVDKLTNENTEDAYAEIVDNFDNQTSDNINNRKSTQTEYPTLKAIAMKKLPASETEWVVVYSFYASKYGNETFTRQALLDLYKESGRAASTTHLSKNITRVVQSGYINPLTDDYSILDRGIEKAKEIVSRTTSAPVRHKGKSQKAVSKDETDVSGATPKVSNKRSNTLKRINDINFEPDGKESLVLFFNRYPTKSDQERNLLFTYYLTKVLEINEVTFNHLYTCYDLLELNISENLPQTVRNTASRTGWIEVKSSAISVTIKGSNQIRSWDKELSKK